MTAITAQDVASLRAKTGAGMMECKKALAESAGDVGRAVELLRARGLKAADMKASRATTAGRVHAYIHHNQRVGVLLEVACETDFVSRGEEFGRLLNEIAMHVAAAVPTPLAVSREQIPAEAVAEEKRQLMMAEDLAGKPDNIKEKIVQGRLEKFIQERALLDQEFIKDPTKKVGDVVKALVAKVGENIQVSRFVRFELGAGPNYS